MPVTTRVFVIGDEGFVWRRFCSAGNMSTWKSKVKSPWFNVCVIVGRSAWGWWSGPEEDVVQPGVAGDQSFYGCKNSQYTGRSCELRLRPTRFQRSNRKSKGLHTAFHRAQSHFAFLRLFLRSRLTCPHNRHGPPFLRSAFFRRCHSIRSSKPVSLSEALLCRHILLLQCIDLFFFAGVVRDQTLVESVRGPVSG